MFQVRNTINVSLQRDRTRRSEVVASRFLAGLVLHTLVQLACLVADAGWQLSGADAEAACRTSLNTI